MTLAGKIYRTTCGFLVLQGRVVVFVAQEAQQSRAARPYRKLTSYDDTELLQVAAIFTGLQTCTSWYLEI